MLKTNIKGIDLEFETSDQVFSPEGVDRGTLAMLSMVEFTHEDKVLDLGCGCGVVGILAAKMIGADKVVMSDKDPRAVELARRNAARNGVGGTAVYESDGFMSLDEKDFTLILSNPPYHTDFAVAKGFIEKGFNRLQIGGRMFMVTKRLPWYKNKLTSIFGGVKVWEIDGYYVFMSIKKDATYASSRNKRR